MPSAAKTDFNDLIACELFGIRHPVLVRMSKHGMSRYAAHGANGCLVSIVDEVGAKLIDETFSCAPERGYGCELKFGQGQRHLAKI